MKKALPLLLCLLCTLDSFSQAPLNANEYRIQTFFVQAFGTIGSDGSGNPPDPAWQIMTANDFNNAPTNLLNTSSGITNPGSFCHFVPSTYNNDWHDPVRFDLISSLTNFSGKIDIDIMSYENDVVSGCIYNSGDQNLARKAFLYNVLNLPLGINSQEEFVVNSGSKVRLSNGWFYANGSRTSPLNFGVINDTTVTYTHANGTFQNSYNSSNEWTATDHPVFSDARDITYTFELDATKVIDFNVNFLNGFSGAAHFVQLDENGNYVENLITRNVANPSIEMALCPGNYAIIFEGFQNAETGRFDFTIDLTDIEITAGTLAGGIVKVPTPQEYPIQLKSDAGENPNSTISNYQIIGGGQENISWEFTDGYTPFTALNPDSNSVTYTIPQWTTNGWFRRKYFDGCTSIVTPSQQIEIYDGANGTISGKVVSNSGSPVSGVTLSLRRVTEVPGGDTTYVHTAVTNSAGFYQFSGLFYGFPEDLGANEQVFFEIVPSKNTHEFNPSIKRDAFFYLSKNNPNSANNDFTDITVFSITGTVTQECDDCVGATPGNPVICVKEDVEFLIDNTYLGNKSLADGTYALSVDNQGTYEVKPRFLDHEFEPENVSLDVGEEVEISNVNFKDTTTHHISGVVRAGCDQYFGQTKLRFVEQEIDENGDTLTACFVKEITTNLNSGFYTVKLPAGMYKVDVFGFENLATGFNALEMEAFFDNFPTDSLFRDVTTEDATLDLTFHEVPELVVSGLTAACVNLATPIFEQNVEKNFTVLVYEGNPSKGCLAQDDSVTLSTNVHADDITELFKYKTEGGILDTSIVAGSPNIVPPYQKVFNIDFTDRFGRSAATLSYTPVVTGLKPRTGTFATVSPEIPFLILRDPPGDKSYSYWESSTATETAMRFYTGRGGSVEKWRQVKLGVQFEAGVDLFGVSVATNTEIWGSVKGSLEVGANIRRSTEAIVSMQTTQRYETSDDTQVVGEKGDVFIGAAMNLLYAITDEVVFDAEACSLFTTKDLIIANNGFATEYMYTEGHIKNTLITNLKNIRSITTDDSTKLALSTQISVWEQALERNRQLKRQATYDKNISFDGASGPQESSTTSSSTAISTIEFDMFIDASVAVEAGIEVAGSGVSGGNTYKFKFEAGASSTQTTTNSTTTGFVIDDDDPGDFLSVNIKNDPVYNTPVFETVSGTTSCPHEEDTQPRDGIQLTATNPLLQNVPAGGIAQFNLQLANTSQSEETRNYFLRFVNGSASGATVTVEGNPAIVPFQYTLNYLEQQNITVGVSRFNPNIYSFENIRFEAIDACELGTTTSPDKRKEAEMAAFFQNACSPITLSLPEEGFVVNGSFNNQIPVVIKDYIWANLSDVSLEYASQGSSSWVSAFTLNQGQLQNSALGTSVNWNISNVNDGLYKLRLKLRCGSSVVYSEVVNGVIDRAFPVLVSSPQPADDNYVKGEQISASFNKELGCTALNGSNFTLTKLSDNSTIPATLGCFQNTITILPDASILTAIGDSVEVQLLNIKGKYGNVNPDVISWKFDVGTPPSNTNSLPEINLAGSITGGASSFVSSSENARLATTASALQFNEDGTAKLQLTFSISAAQPNDVTVNYFVSGDAVYQLDFDVVGELTNDGFAGTARILAGQTSVTITIDALDDAIFENDEEVLVSLEKGGDYFIGSQNQVAAIILNDDTLDDCENGGNVYSLTNLEITPGTYHKSSLESDVTINTPTTVIFKGERSVTLNPGFEISGSTFSAIIEDCPENTTFVSADFTGLPSYGFTSNLSEKSSSPSFFSTQSLTNKDDVAIPFESLTDQKFSVLLLNKYGAELAQLSAAAPYAKGSNTFTFSTKGLTSGTYYVKFIGEAKTLYHRVVVR